MNGTLERPCKRGRPEFCSCLTSSQRRPQGRHLVGIKTGVSLQAYPSLSLSLNHSCRQASYGCQTFSNKISIASHLTNSLSGCASRVNSSGEEVLARGERNKRESRSTYKVTHAIFRACHIKSRRVYGDQMSRISAATGLRHDTAACQS